MATKLATALNAMRLRMMRNILLKKNAIAAAQKEKIDAHPPLSLLKVTAIHKSIVQVMPKRNVTLGRIMGSMKHVGNHVGSSVTFKSEFKIVKLMTLRTRIKPRVAKKKLVVIKPTKKTLGRCIDLTKQGLKELHGHDSDFAPIDGEFAGVSGQLNPFAIHAGAKSMMSVPVDRSIDESTKSVRLFVSGIPAWLDPVKVYYDLLIYLAKHYCLILLTLHFTSHADDDGCCAAWADVTLNDDAEKCLERESNQLSCSVHTVFSIPESIKISPLKLSIIVVEDL